MPKNRHKSANLKFCFVQKLSWIIVQYFILHYLAGQNGSAGLYFFLKINEWVVQNFRKFYICVLCIKRLWKDNSFWFILILLQSQPNFRNWLLPWAMKIQYKLGERKRPLPPIQHLKTRKPTHLDLLRMSSKKFYSKFLQN